MEPKENRWRTVSVGREMSEDRPVRGRFEMSQPPAQHAKTARKTALLVTCRLIDKKTMSKWSKKRPLHRSPTKPKERFRDTIEILR